MLVYLNMQRIMADIVRLWSIFCFRSDRLLVLLFPFEKLNQEL